MGAQNVAQVFAHWTSRLTARESLALTYMALISLDADAPSVYWGGWEALARALGHDPDTNPSSAAEQARRAVSALVKAGAIVSSGRARAGVNAEYALALDPAATWKPSPGSGRKVTWDEIRRAPSPTETVGQEPEKPHRKGAPRTHRNGAPEPHRKGGTSPTKTVPPMRTEEPLQEYSQEPIPSPQATYSPVGTDAESILDDQPAPWDQPASSNWGSFGTPTPAKPTTGRCNDCGRGNIPKDQLHRVIDAVGLICEPCIETNGWRAA